jgi:hypothetical protein
VVVGRGRSLARSGSGGFVGAHHSKCSSPRSIVKGENRGFMACACMHVLLCWCRTAERRAVGSGKGVPAWLRGVWGLGALLTSSHVIRGVGAGLGKRKGRNLKRGLNP